MNKLKLSSKQKRQTKPLKNTSTIGVQKGAKYLISKNRTKIEKELKNHANKNKTPFFKRNCKIFQFFIIITLILAGLLYVTYLLLPKSTLLDNFTFSSAIYDKNGQLLRLTLSRDDKYRLFTPLKDIPENAKKALILYEDKNFYTHNGVDTFAIARAAFSMLTGGRKQGASTITMQLARLVYDIDSTSIYGKIQQIVRALQIERHYSKDKILESYFNLAPYGDNIEGLGAAALIYFHNDVKKLSLPELLTLIVVPQNPSKRNPNKNGPELAEARKRLSGLWLETHPDDTQNAYLDLPLKIYTRSDIPFLAPHFTNLVLNQKKGSITTTLDIHLQHALESVTRNYLKRKKEYDFKNAAVMVLDYKTMEVVSYIGSADFFNSSILGQVDGLKAQRSPGSAMKPFIYALAIEQGLIHPLTLLKDLPKSYAFYNPENFDHGYRGVVSATSALVYSLNIPAVDLLQKLSGDSFYTLLKKGGVKGLKSERFYGLALALGGFEISMQEMVKLYAALVRGGTPADLKFIKENQEDIFQHNANLNNQDTSEEKLFSPEAGFLTLKMLGYNDPVDGNKSIPVYWKTGTSYSYKDAWSIGIAGKYVIGVWIGNFDGTPNHSFVGRTAAAPLFFEIVRTLQKYGDFSKYTLSPDGLNLARIDICRSTGDIANAYCPDTVKSWFIPGVSPIKLSGVHRRIVIDKKTGLRACRHTPPTTELKIYEFWPTDVLNAFERAGLSKKTPPPFLKSCDVTISQQGVPPQIIYPISNIIHLVRSHKLEDEKIILKASTDPDARLIYWFMDGALLGQSTPNETLAIKAIIGTHEIKAVDDLGRSSVKKLRIQLED